MKSETFPVFTYQNLDGRGWAALAAAMAHAGILPITAFPMFGDGASGLHKHENSISWDCALVCRTGPPVGAFEVRHTGNADGAAFADRWRRKLEDDGHALSPGDVANMRHVGRFLAAFEKKAWEDDGRGAVASYTKGAARPIHG